MSLEVELEVDKPLVTVAVEEEVLEHYYIMVLPQLQLERNLLSLVEEEVPVVKIREEMEETVRLME